MFCVLPLGVLNKRIEAASLARDRSFRFLGCRPAYKFNLKPRSDLRDFGDKIHASAQEEYPGRSPERGLQWL
jgi:hypothetical protein